ncbi:alkylglycerol monooxygenase [Chlorella sorokiniana]|uniref:Alkylglycerol monooxygenase n=1 Tax=Chlorella sorokiniana TaxID=3076 RepID=A0A2P6TDA5_CHLSO|nr:alkylglycerol monooxygenase [Chlorella sorokiniana]|eukprot:PRW20628.1 alkylglycerol monooxygenase [Chlorella sorokiniana]
MMRKQVYNLRQLINNLTAPMFFHLVARLGMRACIVLPYKYIYDNYRIVEYNNKHAWWLHLTALLFCDFCTYW